MSEVLISLQNVSISYPLKTGFLKWSKHTPFSNISIDIHPGETIGIIGNNGVGKSTLLRVIAGIIEPNNGYVVNHGASVSLLSLGVGFVPHLTGRENAILSGMLLGFRKKEIIQRLDIIREFSELGSFFEQPLRTYSTGMRMRLGFSVAIQVKTDILLIDEVLGVGDKDFQRKSTTKINSLINSEKAVVLVSHNVATIKELCDSVVWIEDGRVIYAGDVEPGIAMYNQTGKEKKWENSSLKSEIVIE